MGLVLSPGFLALAFLESQALVILLKLLVCLMAFNRVFVFHNATHASDSFSLLGVGMFFSAVLRVNKVFLAGLLVSPVLLIQGVDHHAFVIH